MYDTVVQFIVLREGGSHGTVGVAWTVSANQDISSDISPTNGTVSLNSWCRHHYISAEKRLVIQIVYTVSCKVAELVNVRYTYKCACACMYNIHAVSV